MAIYRDEYHQIEKIILFFSKKMKILVAIILILGIGIALVGWYYWSNRHLNRVYERSQFYEKIVNSVYFGCPQQALIDAEKFILNSKDIYGALISLKIAKLYIDKNELDKAEIKLQQGISMINDDSLKSLINLRLARIQVQQKKANDALKTLHTVKEKEFISIVSDLRGEALLSKGDKQRAYSTWKIGMKSNISPMMCEIIKMKINNLSI